MHRAGRRKSKSDYQIYAAFAEKLGIGPMFTEGKDELGWIEQYYNATDMPKHMTFAEFRKKGYFVVPTNPNRNKNVALRWFAEDREKDTPDWGPRLNNQVDRKGLQTTTGKVEFIATSIKNFEEQGYVDEGIARPCTPTSPPGKAGTARSPRSIRSACSRRIRASASTPWETARTAS